jgi:sporulation protein YlmC with PRC-barrel domain
MDIVRDLLDKNVIDRNGREMGRVDSILLELGEGPPRITALLIGPSVLGARLHPALGRAVAALETRLGIARGRPTTIPSADIDHINHKIRVRVAIGETAAAAFEQLVRRWIAKLPGSH